MAISILPQKPSYISQQSWDHLVNCYGSADNICLRDANGRAYIDVGAMDALVETTAARPIIKAWQQFKSQSDNTLLHSAGPHDAVLGWREFMTSHQTSPLGRDGAAIINGHQQEFLQLAQHPYKSTEDAWIAAKNVEVIPEVQDVSLAGMADYLSRLVAALSSPSAVPTREKAIEVPAAATVGDCFAQAGLWWVIVFFFFLVTIIVGVIVSGGGLAAVAASILGILIASGIWATLGGIIALVICLGGSVGVQIN